MKRLEKTVDEIKESTKNMIMDRHNKGESIALIAKDVKWYEFVTDDNALELTYRVILENTKRGKRHEKQQ